MKPRLHLPGWYWKPRYALVRCNQKSFLEHDTASSSVYLGDAEKPECELAWCTKKASIERDTSYIYLDGAEKPGYKLVWCIT